MEESTPKLRYLGLVTTHPLSQFLADCRARRGTGATTPETSLYPPLESALTAAGKRVCRILSGRPVEVTLELYRRAPAAGFVRADLCARPRVCTTCRNGTTRHPNSPGNTGPP